MWTVHGPTDLESSLKQDVESVFGSCDLSESIYEEVIKYFTVENFGAAIIKEKIFMISEQVKALLMAKQSMKQLDNRYEIKIP